MLILGIIVALYLISVELGSAGSFSNVQLERNSKEERRGPFVHNLIQSSK
ncbi:MAG: hypothetical protein AAGA85_13440 [Bacteroidota bacterium]